MKTFNELVGDMLNERGRAVILSRAKRKEVTVEKADGNTAGDSIEPLTDEERERQRRRAAILRELHTFAREWSAGRDGRRETVSADEGMLRVIQEGDGRKLLEELLALAPPPAAKPRNEVTNTSTTGSWKSTATRLRRALNADRVAKSATFATVVKAALEASTLEKLRHDPFAATGGTLAERLEGAVVGPRPDLARLPFDRAVEAVEESYPGLLRKVLEGVDRPGRDSAREELARRVSKRLETEPELSRELAADRELEADPELASRVLAEE